MADRIQKVLAGLGLGSRREIEQWIRDGRLSLNGTVVQLGDKFSPGDKLLLDGCPLKVAQPKQRSRVLLYHKPAGEVCTRSDPEGRPTIFDHLPELPYGRWITVGRLDLNSAGVLLLTNDGELAHRLMHPKYHLEREYAVRLLGTVDKAMIKRLREGVVLDDGVSRFDEIQFQGGKGANSWYHVTLHSGKNREVRRLWDSQGITVSRLIRVRFGTIALPRDLKAGESRELPKSVVESLFAWVKD